ncbi:hypothetical protein GCM10009537_16850 [Corynebacterium riegelii]
MLSFSFFFISQIAKGRRIRKPIKTRRKAWVAGSMFAAFTCSGVAARKAVPRARTARALPCDTGLTGEAVATPAALLGEVFDMLFTLGQKKCP